MIAMPVIDQGKCDGCGLCINVCRGDAVAMVGRTVAAVETGNCDWCTDCEAVCRTGAISCSYEIIG